MSSASGSSASPVSPLASASTAVSTRPSVAGRNAANVSRRSVSRPQKRDAWWDSNPPRLPMGTAPRSSHSSPARPSGGVRIVNRESPPAGGFEQLPSRQAGPGRHSGTLGTGRVTIPGLRAYAPSERLQVAGVLPGRIVRHADAGQPVAGAAQGLARPASARWNAESTRSRTFNRPSNCRRHVKGL